MSKFEVGKTYKMASIDTLFTCVWANDFHATLTWGKDQACTESHVYLRLYREYKEPEIRTIWVNVYPRTDRSRDTFYVSKELADEMTGASRIKCIELKYEV